jgi:D-glycerate 3-kinase
MSKTQIEKLLDDHERTLFPETFLRDAEQYYLPLAKELVRSKPQDRPLFLGINGAQGTGKSTLACFLEVALTSIADWRVAVLSIDDFYLTKVERDALAREIHPLLKTRGVPGTHDVDMMSDCLNSLCTLAPGEQMTLPRFDKSTDDRAARSAWSQIEGPVDLIILEGWCVGSQSQTEAELSSPINDLEREEDSDGVWRRFVNQQLHNRYGAIFERLDFLIFLKAPGFDEIHRWRMQQEKQLAVQMSETALKRFIQHFERLTRANQESVPGSAHIVIELGSSHEVADVHSSVLAF